MERPLIALFRLIDGFESVGIEYVVVGSIASSVHGEYRASADVDVVANVVGKQVEPLLNNLRPDFYVDDLAVTKAIEHGRSFNAIHSEAIFKIDVFIPASDLARQELKRREIHEIVGHRIWIASAEDTILSKLDWYRRGNEVSEQQWRDVKGILGTQGSRLDFQYLRLWAARANVLDLLERAHREIT